MASRRQVNAEGIVRNILQKFKDDNPTMIERLKANHSNDKTDCSANYTLTNSRQPKHFSNIIVNQTTSTNRFSISDEDLFNAMSSAVDPSNNSRKASTNENHSLVKSSNGLLNNVMFLVNDLSMGEDTHIDNNNKDEEEELNANICANSNVRSSNRERNEENSRLVGDIDTDISDTTNNKSHMSTNVSRDTTQSLITEGEKVEHEDFSDDSDIAEALTQVIEEFSAENHSSTSTELISLDDEFISDVVNEINEDLMSGVGNVDNIILTPPPGFRDDYLN